MARGCEGPSIAGPCSVRVVERVIPNRLSIYLPIYPSIHPSMHLSITDLTREYPAAIAPVGGGATVQGGYGTPEAGTCTAHVLCVAPRGKLPCASGTYSTQEAGTCVAPYAQHGGGG
eukprot:scaffold98802_cov45-Phaeocystis_antarctica.AAC.1